MLWCRKRLLTTLIKKVCQQVFSFRRLPCVKGAGAARRLRDCLKNFRNFTIPPSFSDENATSLYTREAL